MNNFVIVVILLVAIATLTTDAASVQHPDEQDFYSMDDKIPVVPDLVSTDYTEWPEVEIDGDGPAEPEFQERQSKDSRGGSPKLNRIKSNVLYTDFNVDVNDNELTEETKVYIRKCKSGSLIGVRNNSLQATECISCACNNYDVTCKREQCPDLDCEEAVKVEGECCPQCPEKLCEAHDGRRFQDGGEWHIDDCTFCECRKGETLCSVEDCQIPKCPNPIRVPGQCCPVCPDGECHSSNSSLIKSGEVWKEGVCTHCYCRGGEKKCAEEKCPFVNCADAYVPEGECCKRCPSAIDCIPSTWGVWGDCPIQECGGGMRRRYRSVVVPPILGGSFCPHMSEAQLCPQLPCDVLPVCPTTDWTSWSQCTATCGNGFRMRSRQKDKVTKATMLINCDQTHMEETTKCYAGSCADATEINDHLGIDNDICFDTTWSEWGPCSEDCGVGVSTRRQVLKNPDHPMGHFCRLITQRQKCHGQKCSDAVVNCKVSSWSVWTPCSVSCGPTGKRTKHRTIKRHPANGGRPCPALLLTKSCKNSPPCDILEARSMFSDLTCTSADGSKVYAENEFWFPTPCQTCHCEGGVAHCAKQHCLELNCDVEPIEFPGLCCKICPNTEFQGKISKHKIKKL